MSSLSARPGSRVSGAAPLAGAPPRRCSGALGFGSGLLAALGLLGSPRPTSAAPDAQEPEAPLHSLSTKGYAALGVPAGMVEFGFGWLTLPGAAVCTEEATQICRKGDTSLQVDGWPLYRASKRLAFGAGITLGLIPTTDAPKVDPPGVERQHSRRYLTTEGIARYYLSVGDGMEGWFGLTSGLVVVSDAFTSTESFSDKALIGSRGVTIRTEGFTLGAAGGFAFSLAPGWSLVTTLRYGNWFLPDARARDALGDEASVAGRNTMFSVGLGIGYRTLL